MSLGGSAMYFTITASRFAPVLVLGIAGEDTIGEFRSILEGCDADLSGVVVSRAPTFTWHAVHDFDRWTTASESSEPGCEPEWRPRLSDTAASAPVLFLASLAPRVQLAVLHQSSARCVAADSMTVFMRSDPEAVRMVVDGCDILFLTRSELQVLTGESEWRRAAAVVLEGRRPRAVVVKAGPRGAALVTRSEVLERPAAPVERVVDPTGAGDAFAGAFLGTCAAAERDDAAILRRALDAAIAAAAAAITSFGPRDLMRAARAGGARDV